MLTLTQFSRGRDIDPKTVSAYMKRHKMPYDKNVGLTDEQISILDEIYPVPKPIVVVQGLSATEERQLRQALEDALTKLSDAHRLLYAQSEQLSQLKALELKADTQETELKRLKNRNLLERILNK